jgi:hypothetical protein
MDEQFDDPERPTMRPRVVDKRRSAQPASTEPSPEASSPAPDESPPEPTAPEPTAEPSPGSAPPPGDEVWTPEQEAEAMRIAQEIAATPSLDWIVNSAMTLLNVAGTKLELGDAQDAGPAIDALAALLNGMQGRLQQAEAPLRQALAQLQMAYASRVAPPPTP